MFLVSASEQIMGLSRYSFCEFSTKKKKEERIENHFFQRGMDLILKSFLILGFEGCNARVHSENCSDDER